MRMTRQQVESMIKYEDEAVLVVHKPSFLAVETKDPRQKDLVSLLVNRRAAAGETPYIGLVHRLDQPVEGLVVLAKTKQAAAALSKELGAGDFVKEYLAVVQGVTQESDTLVHTLKRDGRTNTSSVVPAGSAGGKEARLSYRRLAVAKGADGENGIGDINSITGMQEKSLLRITLDTGRHHQIRVQFAAIGHPLLGDVKYGAGSEKTTNREPQPLALCSCRLAFTHPKTGQPMAFHTVPVGAGFAEFTAALEASGEPERNIDRLPGSH